MAKAISKHIERFNRIKEFVAKIRVDVEMRPQELTSADVLEIHWLVKEFQDLEKIIVEFLTEKIDEDRQ